MLVIIIIASVVFWLVLALALRGYFARRRRARDLARLTRSLVFATAASIAGPALLALAPNWPRDLLTQFAPRHACVFALAAGHWFVSFIEDIRASDPAGAEKSFVFEPIRDELAAIVRLGYAVHHAATFAIYLVLLETRRLSGLGAIGLLYELPVCFQLSREIRRDRVYDRSRAKFDAFWLAWLAAFAVARGGPTFLYIVSLIWWRRQLTNVLSTALLKVLYHGSASFFTYINCTYFSLMVGWYQCDKAALSSSSSSSSRPTVGATAITTAL